MKIEEFLNSFTDSEFQGVKLHSHFPHEQTFPNYVPDEFEEFMDSTIQEWSTLGALREWEKVRNPNDPLLPTVISPLGVEPSKPRALWDGRFVNEFCRHIPFCMDNASKVAEVSWEMHIFSNWTTRMDTNMFLCMCGFMEILWGVLEGKILRFYSPSIWVEKQPYCLPFPYRCSSNVYQIFGHSNGSLDR